jgi:hypothetical protein
MIERSFSIEIEDEDKALETVFDCFRSYGGSEYVPSYETISVSVDRSNEVDPEYPMFKTYEGRIHCLPFYGWLDTASYNKLKTVKTLKDLKRSMFINQFSMREGTLLTVRMDHCVSSMESKEDRERYRALVWVGAVLHLLTARNYKYCPVEWKNRLVFQLESIVLGTIRRDEKIECDAWHHASASLPERVEYLFYKLATSGVKLATFDQIELISKLAMTAMMANGKFFVVEAQS